MQVPFRRRCIRISRGEASKKKKKKNNRQNRAGKGQKKIKALVRNQTKGKIKLLVFAADSQGKYKKHKKKKEKRSNPTHDDAPGAPFGLRASTTKPSQPPRLLPPSETNNLTQMLSGTLGRI